MFFAKGEINMNNIYKVIWSKAKNCYVVASEIARSHTKSATGSEKIGGVTRRSLLASLMALSLLCGGLGVASAADVVHVDDSATGTAEVYTTAKVDTLLNGKADETAVTTALDGKANTSLNNLDDAGKSVIKTTMADELAKKADATALNDKANTSLNNLDDAGKSVIKTTMADELAKKADATALDGKANTSLDNLSEAGKSVIKTTMADELAKKADATALDGKANTSLDNLSDAGKSVIKDTMAGELAKKADATALDTKADKATTLAGYGITDAYTKADVDTKLAGKADKATTLAGYGITDAYTKGDVDTRLNEKADKTALTQATDRITANETTIAGLTTKTTKITYDAALGTNVDGVTFNAGAVTGVTSINGTEIGTKESGEYIHQDNSIWGNMKKVDTQVKTNADAIAQEKTDREKAIGSLTEDKNYIKKDKNVSDNLVELDKQAKANADAITETNQRTQGITRNDIRNETSIEGKVTVDTNGNIKAEGTITSNGLDAKSGEITTTGKVSAGDVSTGTLETTGDATIGGDLKVKGILNTKDVTAETIHISKSENTVDYKSEGSIIGEGGKLSVSNEKFDKINNITEKSELNVNEKGTVNWATSTDNATGNVTKGCSEVKADHIKNSVMKTEGGKTFGYDENITADSKVGTATDKDGNKNELTQTATGTENTVTSKDGNKSTTKQEAGSISSTVYDKDGNVKASSEMKEDGSISNNATGDMTNTVGGKLTTTVTGATEENYNGGLTTNVTGEENHTVTGKQNNKVTGKQTNTVEGGQENIISGGQTNTITGGQINNITGDQTTTITGNKTETVTENVTEDYKKNLTTTVGGNEIHEVKGTKTETVEGKVIENFKGGQETTVTGNQDIHVTENQTNKIDGNQANTIGGDQTTTAKNITNAADETLTDKVGTNTRVITSRSITDTVGRANRMIEDGKITDNAGDFTVTTDKENGTTFTNAGSTASSFTTVDGTNTGSAQGRTNVKGNEISTGKVEANYVKMDYADVMNDLGVKGTTTTKTLKVTENATVGGTLDVTQKATFHDDVDITKNLSVGGNATITGDVTANSYKVGDKTYISADGINANNQKITNVADGSISEGSKDAVNGGQLYGVKRDLEHQVDKVGANAAAMANLRPMEFDPSSKWNIAAAIGNYGSETAAAIGAFYRPNDNVMVNLSTAFGTGENMVGGGVSVRLGKGGNKLSREETNALKAQVADLSARMDALLSVLNPNMSKDFPDVPENHWAYEAVSRLAGNDIVQGYPDGEFHGERTMTRYEMAEIIYNALSRGAEAEKELVEEFKPELQAMAASEKATAEKAEG